MCQVSLCAVLRNALLALLLLPGCARLVEAQGVYNEYPHPTPLRVTSTSHGLSAVNDYEHLEITFCNQHVVHVIARPAQSTEARHQRPWMLGEESFCPGLPVTGHEDERAFQLTAGELGIVLDKQNGRIDFKLANGSSLLDGYDTLGRSYMSSATQPAGTYQIEARFRPDSSEAIYGLGQHQGGLFNYRGNSVQLAQNNTDVAIPLLVSSKGWGIFWNTASYTLFDNRFPLEMNLSSSAADAIDYYLVYGPSSDEILHQYRAMTGHAPLLPAWSYGFFQSKDRYKSQAEMLDVAAGYRSRHIPLDGLVQDWYWWREGGEGDPVYNANYTDVPAELDTLHKEHVHAMISLWGLMDESSANYKAVREQGLEIPGTHVYDSTNPKAGDFFWKNLAGKLFAQGWDAFWLDSSEPEESYPHWGDAILRYKNLHLGSGLEYTNIFPFEHTAGVADHWQASGSDKRVFLLTRSAFAGQQRNGVTVWSGDVYATWWALRHQIPAGLNMALSGYPYWTTDIGGYHLPHWGEKVEPGYDELYTRWFEYGVFCPIFRTHGHREHNELWSYPAVEQTLVKYDQLRYRLLPYIYAQAWQISSADSTLQRPLVMDFREDAATWEIGDEFLFGPSLLVAPVTEQGAESRNVYLPKGTEWIDFWSGKTLSGGTRPAMEAPLERIPLLVRAGSILPMGPHEEYVGQKLDPLELRIYPGADASFLLYEDAGDGHGYQHGEQSTIEVQWHNASRTLTMAARQGSYPGMATRHRIEVVLVRPGHGNGIDPEPSPDAVADYDGHALQLKF